MNKTIICGMIGLLIIAGVIGAGELLSTDKSIELTKTDKDALTSIGITRPTIEQLNCDDNICSGCMKDGKVGAGCIKIPKNYCAEQDEETLECLKLVEYTSQELLVLRDKAIEDKLKQIAKVTLARQSKIEDVKLMQGNITLVEER